jgi:GTP-binding protein HflX
MRALTGSDIYVADQLFATLDPTTRRIGLPSGRQALLTDTVGFIQKLPTTLIAAFRATLEEITEADVLLEVADVSHPNVIGHLETVADTLAEIEMPPVPRILVWNKLDQWGDQPLPQPPHGREYADIVATSGVTGQGLNALTAAIERVLSTSQYRLRLRLPYNRGDLVSMLHDLGTVYQQTHTDEGIELVVRVPANLYERFLPYRITG